MDNSTKNKAIAAFMGITYYHSYTECRDKKIELFDQSGDAGTFRATAKWQELDAQHQWQPEYQNSFDRLIPVAIKVLEWLSERDKDEDSLFEMYCNIHSTCENHIWSYNRMKLFDTLYEAVTIINQFIKNKTDAANQSTITEVQPDSKSV